MNYLVERQIQTSHTVKSRNRWGRRGGRKGRGIFFLALGIYEGEAGEEAGGPRSGSGEGAARKGEPEEAWCQLGNPKRFFYLFSISALYFLYLVFTYTFLIIWVFIWAFL